MCFVSKITISHSAGSLPSLPNYRRVQINQSLLKTYIKWRRSLVHSGTVSSQLSLQLLQDGSISCNLSGKWQSSSNCFTNSCTVGSSEVLHAKEEGGGQERLRLLVARLVEADPMHAQRVPCLARLVAELMHARNKRVKDICNTDPQKELPSWQNSY
jgi:hypothetical protein